MYAAEITNFIIQIHDNTSNNYQNLKIHMIARRLQNYTGRGHRPYKIC